MPQVMHADAAQAGLVGLAREQTARYRIAWRPAIFTAEGPVGVYPARGRWESQIVH